MIYCSLLLILQYPCRLQVEKVKDFYQEQLNDISQRMEALKESVDTSRVNFKQKPRRSSNLVETITQRFETMMHGKHLPGHTRSDSSPSYEIRLAKSVSDDDVHDLESQLKRQSSSDKMDLERESDSIKRALTDIYRTAKMLHNFSIMVSHMPSIVKYCLQNMSFSL